MTDRDHSRVWGRAHWCAVGACLTAFVAAGLIADLVLQQVTHLEDEVAYLFQAKVFSIGKLSVPSPPEPSCFFAPFVLDYGGRRFGKYPPGWPALLALGVRLGQPWWINAGLGALTVALVFRLGSEVHGPVTGAVASLLGSLSPFMLILSASMMAHTACLAFATAFLWAFWRSTTDWRLRWPWIAGLMLGCAFLIRPFTAIALAVPAGLYRLWRLLTARDWKPLWLTLLGFAPLALLLPLTNAVWTGDPLISPYTLFWPYDRVGFGPGHGLLEQGNTVWLGLGSAVISVGHLATHLLGWPALSLTPAVLLFLFRPRYWWDLFLATTALSLILAYVMYWTNGDVFGPRYIFESSSALLILTATGIVRMGRWMRRSLRPAYVGVIAMLVCVDLLVYLPNQLRQYRGLYGITDAARHSLQAAGLHQALVLVQVGSSWKDYAVAFSMNEPLLDGDVVYARECAGSTEQLLAQYQGRDVYAFNGIEVRPYVRGETQ